MLYFMHKHFTTILWKYITNLYTTNNKASIQTIGIGTNLGNCGVVQGNTSYTDFVSGFTTAIEIFIMCNK